MKNSLHFYVNKLSDNIRFETIGKTDFLVAPVVALREGVLNEELISSDVIAAMPFAWNGRPFVIGHPEDEDGRNISANSPDVLDKYQIGILSGFHFEGNALKGEIWIDLARAELVEDGQWVVSMIKNKQPLDVSTAYWREPTFEEGEFNGAEYVSIAHDIMPDHLAGLPGESGACSWDDGCGVPRANNDSDNPESKLAGLKQAAREFFRTNFKKRSCDMDKIEEIIASGKLQFNKEQLEAMTDDQIDGIHTLVTQEIDVEDVDDEDDEDDEDVDTNEDDDPCDQDEEPLDLRSELDDIFSDVGGLDEAKRLISELRTNDAAAKTAVLDAIMANGKNTFSREQLDRMDVDQLETLQKSFVEVDYSLLGNVQDSSYTGDDLEAFPVPDMVTQEAD